MPRLPVLLALLACAPFAHAQAHPRELVLAGGALHLCSSLAARDCSDASTVADAAHRGEPRYRIDAAGLADALDPALALWPASSRDAIATGLRAAARTLGAAPVTREALVAALDARCDTSTRAHGCFDGRRTPWAAMDDDARDALLAAFEVPQRDAAGARLQEAAQLDASARRAGVDILRAFVAAAATRAPGRRPRIALVTASAFDPFDPVDAYAGWLTQAGADVEWWPVDRALAAAVLDGRGCEALPALRRSVLHLPGRERVYPDLAARQAQACADPVALRTLPDRVQGIFFTGGDQNRLRRAFFDAADRPNAWLVALRDAVARGDVVVSGTSAGSAVQSGGPMIGNGESSDAFRDGAHAVAAPVPGCRRAGTCASEDVMTFAPSGLGLLPDVVVDTHFSQRGRELRLLRVLSDTHTSRGVGIDEASAVHVQLRGGVPELEARGASGAWLFDATPGCVRGTRVATLHYLAPGVRWRWARDGRLTALGELRGAAPMRVDATASDAFAPLALRTAAQRLAATPALGSLRLQADGHAVRLSTTSATRRWRNADAPYGITALRLEIDDAPDCPR